MRCSESREILRGCRVEVRRDRGMMWFRMLLYPIQMPPLASPVNPSSFMLLNIVNHPEGQK